MSCESKIEYSYEAMAAEMCNSQCSKNTAYLRDRLYVGSKQFITNADLAILQDT